MSSPPLKKRKIGDPLRPQKPKDSSTSSSNSDSSTQIKEPLKRSYQIQRFLFNDPDNDSTTWAIIEGRKQESHFPESQTTAESPGSCEDDSSAAGAEDTLITSVTFHRGRSAARLAESTSRLEGPHAEYRATKNNLKYPDSEPCKEGKHFPTISKLREHLKRVHSPEYRCQDCDHKFSQVAVAELQDLRDSHRGKCNRSGRTPLDNFDMSAEQWEKCKNWSQNQKVDRGSKNGIHERKPAWSWRRIYNSLFPSERAIVAPEAGAFKQNPRPQASAPRGPPKASVRVLPKAPSKMAVAGNGNLNTPAPAIFMSSYSLDYKWVPNNEVQTLVSAWDQTNPEGPSSITPSSTSGTTETVESAASTQPENPTTSMIEFAPRIVDDVYMGSESPEWDYRNMNFLTEHVPTASHPQQYGTVDDVMDGSGI